MATSFGALCSDFYVNQKLALKMDLPADRETVLHLFERVRKAVPRMDKFRRYEGELALESSRQEGEYQWVALRRTSVRTGHVNPASMEEAYKLHRLMLELAPYNLTISPLDVAYVELLMGFDLECKANHDEVVYDALLAQSPLEELLRVPNAKINEVQPLFGLSLGENDEIEATFEVRTRTKMRRRRPTRRSRNEPISIFLTLRHYGPIDQVSQLHEMFSELAGHAETLATERLVPGLLNPIAQQIISSNT